MLRQADRLAWAYVRDQLAPLVELKDAPEILLRLDELRQRIES